jgi:hypothetical protein
MRCDMRDEIPTLVCDTDRFSTINIYSREESKIRLMQRSLSRINNLLVFRLIPLFFSYFHLDQVLIEKKANSKHSFMYIHRKE